ncbi:MAG: arylsulfatase [Alphaproteobacteria bacterium]|nr:arylsulfatase [Alphaproteobacteria bacterium]
MTARHPSGEDFKGVIGRTVADSKPWWPPAKCPTGKPNVVVIVFDDTGFAHFGCYGSTIETPSIDALAANGLRYSGFHTTALCSPSRACLLTGRNHHAVQMRAISNFDTGFPHMRGAVPRTAATLAEILRDEGYATFAAGKWHLAPMGECSAAGPFHNWPLQKGFDRYYGFLQGETDQFSPELTQDNHFVDPPGTAADGYHASEDFVDRSIGFVRDVTSLVPEKPFFLYLAFGATHAPHQAPKSYLEKYRGRFDGGWDEARAAWFARQIDMGIVPPGTELAPHNPGVRPWADLSADERRFAARLQEAFAAMLDHTDAQIGRLVAALREIGRLDDTLLVIVSDNGASQEGHATGVMDEMRYFNGLPEDMPSALARLDDIGGPKSHTNIPWGWAQAGNTPLKWYKQNTHGGGVRDPFVVHWPKGISARGAIRPAFCHMIDIAPTVLDCLGIEPPAIVNGVKQMPLHGRSLKATFEDASARARTVQYFEMFGHRGIYADGWKAVTRHAHGADFDKEPWELYHLDKDFSECGDLAAKEPERLKALVELWWREAEENGVLPVDDRVGPDVFRTASGPGRPGGRDRYVYYPPVSHIVSDTCPTIARGVRLAVTLDHPRGGEGALVARGTASSGFALYVKGERPVFDFSFFGKHVVLRSQASLAPGTHEIVLDIVRNAQRQGEMSLLVDGAVVARGTLPLLIWMISTIGMDIGRSLAPINDEYAPPFEYPGRIATVVFDLPPARSEADRRREAEVGARTALGSQ